MGRRAAPGDPPQEATGDDAPRGSARASFTLVTQYYPPERGAAQVRLGLDRGGPRRGEADEVEVVTALPNYPLGRIFDGWSRRRCNATTEVGCRGPPCLDLGIDGQRPRPDPQLPVVRRHVAARLGDDAAYGTGSWSSTRPCSARSRRCLVARLRRQAVAIIVADLWVDSIVEIGTIPRGPRDRVPSVGWSAGCSAGRDAVTAVTEGVRDALRRQGRRSEHGLAWLPNGADTDLFAPGPEDPTVRERAGARAGRPPAALRRDARLRARAGGGARCSEPARATIRSAFVLVGDGSEKPELVRRGPAAEARQRDVPRPRRARGGRPAAPDARPLGWPPCARATSTGPSAPPRRCRRWPPATPVIYSGDDEGSRLVASHRRPGSSPRPAMRRSWQPRSGRWSPIPDEAARYRGGGPELDRGARQLAPPGRRLARAARCAGSRRRGRRVGPRRWPFDEPVRAVPAGAGPGAARVRDRVRAAGAPAPTRRSVPSRRGGPRPPPVVGRGGAGSGTRRRGCARW